MKLNLLCCFILLLFISCSKKRTLFVVAGQSNAMGVGDSLKSVFGSEPCFEYDMKLDSLIKVKDPTGQTYYNFQNARSGSLIPALAYTYYKISTSDVFIIQCAKGGSALNEKAEQNLWGNWSKKGNLLQSSFNKIDASLPKIKGKIISELKSSKKKEKFKKEYNIDISAIIWSQGENDGEAIALGILTKEEYELSLIELITNYRRKYGVNTPFIIIETGRRTNSLEIDKGFAIVRELQRKIAKEDEHTYIGYNQTVKFAEKGWLKDAVHYNQEALNDIGKELAFFISTIKINNNLDL